MAPPIPLIPTKPFSHNKPPSANDLPKHPRHHQLATKAIPPSNIKPHRTWPASRSPLPTWAACKRLPHLYPYHPQYPLPTSQNRHLATFLPAYVRNTHSLPSPKNRRNHSRAEQPQGNKPPSIRLLDDATPLTPYQSQATSSRTRRSANQPVRPHDHMTSPIPGKSHDLISSHLMLAGILFYCVSRASRPNTHPPTHRLKVSEIFSSPRLPVDLSA